MTYQATVDYLFRQLPMFQRIGIAAYKKDLTNTIALCDALGQPQHQFPTIHIAGTNGKGSTAHMIAACYQAEGLKVGLYTSPHYVDFRERIKINGAWISEQFVIDFVKEYKDIFEQIKPSFFEITVAMCFAYFAEEKVDIAVIETGLGGRLDSTNIITPLISIITNITYDHQSLLGNTLPEIAGEKAGIIKKGVPVVIGQRQPTIAHVFEQKASDCQSNIYFASERYEVNYLDYQIHEQIVQVTKPDGSPIFERLHLNIGGTYQSKNLKTVLCALAVLKMQGWGVSRSSVINGLKNLQSLTNFCGRFQIIQRDPLIIIDSGHNEDGLRHAMHELQYVKKDKKIMVLGFVNDKKVDKILPYLPKDARYIFTQPSVERAMPVNELKKLVQDVFKEADYVDSYAEAIALACSFADENTFIYVGGSSFMVGDALSQLKSKINS